MEIRQKILVVILVILSLYVAKIYSDLCGEGDIRGKDKPEDFDQKVDTETGVSILALANNQNYEVNCCGFVKQFNFHAKTNTGQLHLQVWRPGTTTYSLIDEKIVSVASIQLGTTVTTTLGQNDYFPVDQGDIIGWYVPGGGIVSYDNNGGQVKKATGVASSATHDWASATQETKRDYGINAVLSKGSAPVITNLATTVTISYTDDVAVETLIMTLTVTDADPSDTLTTTMTTSTAYFTFDSTTKEVKTAQVLSIGIHNLDFLVTDRCGRQDTGIIEVTVTNNPPVINNMGSAVETINEALVVEKQLFAIDATDASVKDYLTCTVKSSNPAAGTDKFFIKYISGTAQCGIFVKDQPGLNYTVANKYDLTVEVTDGKDPVTAPFTVYITQNKQPQYQNLQSQITVSTTAVAIGTIVYNVSMTDEEDDSLFYRMECTPPNGPFLIYNSGAVVSDVDMTGSSVTGYDCDVYVSDGFQEVGPRILTITISDINHAPIITNLPSPAPVTVAENGALGASVYQVSVSDQNSLDVHTYTGAFDPGIYANYFVINSDTGEITTSATNTIDYEEFTDKTADITVTVSDGQASDSKLLQITITDVNEPPVFIQNSYSISGNEGPAGTVIGTPSFEVDDPDGDTLTYSIDCTEFTIGSTSGQIGLAAEYDIDALNIATSASVQCNVNVSDGVYQDTATLQVTLSNINDNTPTFSKNTYTFYANANDEIGKVLTGDILAASDGDAGTFGSTTFSLDQSGLPTTFFQVSDSGDIYIIESMYPTYAAGTTLSFMASVTDNGGLTDTAGIDVIVSEYDRYLTFWDDSRNIAWFTMLMIILAALLGLLIFWLVRIVNWSPLLSICKQGPPKRKWKWSPMVEEDPGGRFTPPPSLPSLPSTPKPVTPPTSPTIQQSGKQWDFWKDHDFGIGNLG